MRIISHVNESIEKPILVVFRQFQVVSERVLSLTPHDHRMAVNTSIL